MKQKRYSQEEVLLTSGLTVEGQATIQQIQLSNQVTLGGVTLKKVTPVILDGPLTNYPLYSFAPGSYDLAQFTITLKDSSNDYLFGTCLNVGHNGITSQVSSAYGGIDLWGSTKPTFSTTISGGNVILQLTTTAESVSVAIDVKLFSSSPSYFIDITSQPSNTTVVAGDVPAVFSLTATSNDSGTLSYIWQENSGSGFVDLSDDSTYSGSLTNSLTITTTDTSLNSYTYRCRISSSGDAPDEFSNTVTLTVNTPSVTITSNPQNLTVDSGDPASFTVAATTNETLSTLAYEWQEDSGSGFVALTNTGVYSGTTTTTLAISDATGLNTYEYRCRVYTTSTTAPEQISTIATLTVNV